MKKSKHKKITDSVPKPVISFVDTLETCKTCVVRSTCTKSYFLGTICQKAIEEVQKILKRDRPTISNDEK